MSNFLTLLGIRSAVLLVTFFVVLAISPTTAVFHDAQQGKAYAAGSPERIAKSFDECWNSGNHGMPSHVIYRKGTGWAVGGDAKVGEALDSLFGQSDSNIDVYMFCR